MTDVRDPHDCYETPVDAVRMLVENMWVPGYELSVWDPSCGRGALMEGLLQQTHCPIENVVGTDKWTYVPLTRRLRTSVNYNHPFESFRSIVGGNIIMMNPPYKQADEHVRHAIHLIPLGGTVCALLRFTWITAIKRRDLLSHLTNIIICGRLKMLPPDVEDKGHSGTVDFAWFVFSKTHNYNPRTRIIRAT